MENTEPDDLPLNNEHEENLRMENEILRLKLMAELGAESYPAENIPPQIENEFLKNVLAFEHGSAGAKQIRVYDLLENPDFKPANELDDETLEATLKEIMSLMIKKQIEVDFSGEYDSRTKYRFITEELFEYETNDFLIPGMVMHFSYEEFHPNHEQDIENRTNEFLSAWFNRSLNEYSWELSDSFILPDRKILKRAEVLEKLRNVLDLYSGFTESNYIISNIHFELKEDTGMGYSEGIAKYAATSGNNEKIFFEGPFKLYFSLEYGWWSIFYFVLPGFEF